MKILVLLFAALLVVGCGEKSLSDSAIEKALEEAVELNSLQERNDLYYEVNKSKPYSGWAKVLYRSGQAEELFEIKDGKQDGRALAWEDDGTKTFEAAYKDGALDGHFEVSADYSGSDEGWPNFDDFNYLGAARVVGTIKDGKKHGKWTAYHENEQKAVEMRFKDDTLDGARSEWYENGQKALEGGFKNGNIHGTWTFWNEDGEQTGEGDYKDGDGTFIRSYPSGQKMSQGTYKDSKLDGVFLRWHKNGQKALEGTFKDGEEVSVKYWNSKGEEVETEEEALK